MVRHEARPLASGDSKFARVINFLFPQTPDPSQLVNPIPGLGAQFAPAAKASAALVRAMTRNPFTKGAEMNVWRGYVPKVGRVVFKAPRHHVEFAGDEALTEKYLRGLARVSDRAKTFMPPVQYVQWGGKGPGSLRAVMQPMVKGKMLVDAYPESPGGTVPEDAFRVFRMVENFAERHGIDLTDLHEGNIMVGKSLGKTRPWLVDIGSLRRAGRLLDSLSRASRKMRMR